MGPSGIPWGELWPFVAMLVIAAVALIVDRWIPR
jgi:hypothetical protein